MWPTSLGRSGSRIARLLLKGMSRPMWEYGRLLSPLPVSCSQAQANIVAGCCLVMGLKFAGSANQEAFKCLVCSTLTVIRENKPRITQSAAYVSRELSHLYGHSLSKELVRGLRKPRTSFSCRLYEQFAAYIRRGLCNPWLIFTRINGPIVFLCCCFWRYHCCCSCCHCDIFVITLPLSLPRAINLKFLLLLHQKYYTTQYEELRVSSLTQMKDHHTTNSHYLGYTFKWLQSNISRVITHTSVISSPVRGNRTDEISIRK